MGRIEELQARLAELERRSASAAERADLLNQLAYAYSKVDAAKAREMARDAQRLSQEAGYSLGQAGALWVMSLGSFWQGQYSEAIAYSTQALEIYEGAHDLEGQAKGHNILGSCYLKMGDHARALIHHLKSLKFYHLGRDPRGQALVYNNLGADYAAIADYGRALEYYQQSLSLKREGGHSDEASTLMNIGTVYEHMEEYPAALEHHRQALKLFEEAHDARVCLCYNNIGGVFEKLKEYQKALGYFQKGLEAARARGMRQVEGAILANIGVVLHHLGQDRQARECFEQSLAIAQEIGEQGDAAEDLMHLAVVALDKGTLKESLDFLNRAREIAERMNSPELKSRILEIYSQAYGQYDMLAEAYRYLKEHVELEKTRQRQSLEKTLYRIKIQQQVGEQAREVEALRRRERELEEANRRLEEMNARLREADQQKEFLLRTLEEQNRRLEGLVTEDLKTSLYNQPAFFQKLEQEGARAKRYQQDLSWAVMVVENYRALTAKLSPAKLDRALATLARIIKEQIRMVDLAGLFDPATFLLAFPQTNVRKAEAICQRLQRAMEHHHWDELQSGLSVSLKWRAQAWRQELKPEEIVEAIRDLRETDRERKK